MADNSGKVLALVEAELEKNPSATTEELQNAAKKKYPSAGKLSKRQFNARYALQIKRRKKGGKAKKKVTAAKAPAKRRTRRAAAAVKKVAARAPRPRRAAKAPAAASSGVDRDAVRQQFLRFASDLTAAESRGDLIRVLANVDKYVDAVAKAAG